MSILSNIMNPHDKAKFCQILIRDYPAIFEDIDTLPQKTNDFFQPPPSPGNRFFFLHTYFISNPGLH